MLHEDAVQLDVIRDQDDTLRRGDEGALCVSLVDAVAW